jgi:sodium/hydrogen exchanger 10/11
LIICCLAGQILKQLAPIIRIPYTPLLTIAGLIVGSIPSIRGSELMGVIKDLDPQFMLILFLPALIFESAFSSDWHTFKMQLSKILILAFPMLMAATFLTALVMFYILDYGKVMSFTDCVVFGSIISATDPVAVVALLKELGASKKLATLIEGESLLNDGTAMVIFMIATKLAAGEEMSAGEGLTLFARLSLGGPLLGLAFAILLTFWLSRIHA